MPAYVDANVLVYAFTDGHAKAERAHALLAGAGDGLVASPLVFDEFVWARAKLAGRAAALADGDELLRLPRMAWSAVTREDAADALELMQRHKLDPRDALHAAIALRWGCDTILSDDPDLGKVPHLKRVAP